jgi:hypothetical protein
VNTSLVSSQSPHEAELDVALVAVVQLGHAGVFVTFGRMFLQVSFELKRYSALFTLKRPEKRETILFDRMQTSLLVEYERSFLISVQFF